MFSQIFFLFSSLILISIAPEGYRPFWEAAHEPAFTLSLIAYAGLLVWMSIQARGAKFFKISSHIVLILSQLELLLFLCAYQFGWGGHRLFLYGSFPIVTPFVALAFYLFGIGWAYYTISSVSYASKQVLFVLPFCIPFLLFGVLFDIINVLPFWQSFSPFWADTLGVLLYIGLLGLTLILMPALIITCWRCQPIRDPILLERLENVCKRMGFKHGGMKIWTIMQHSCTAGIIGIMPRFRYVMFTERLLKEFTPEEIEAILIHEMGHSHYKHLLFYPFILMGMLVSATLIVELILKSVFERVEFSFFEGNFFLLSFFLFIGYACFLGLYFRFIFGFFSRLFERQADLHIFQYSSPLYMIQALDHIAVVSGYTHRQPSWHHFSIQERIDFLHQAIQNPPLVNSHHYKVKVWVWIYFLFLGVSSIILMLI